MSRPFRVLLLDDHAELQPLVRRSAGSENIVTNVFGWCHTANRRETQLEIFVMKHTTQEKAHRVFPAPGPNEEKTDWQLLPETLLPTLDVLVLDQGGVKTLNKLMTYKRVEENFKKANLVPPKEEVFDTAKHTLEGASFYHHYLTAFSGATAVFILTRYDVGDTSAAEHKVLREYIYPFCNSPLLGLPPTFMSPKGQCRRVAEHIQCLFKLFSEGFHKLENLHEIEYAAFHSDPVMLVGESGVGKEGVARAIHERWLREDRRGNQKFTDIAEQNFVALNASTFVETLVESQLFGFVRGAFNEARRDTPGYLHEANGGTLFLDEFGDLPSFVQVRLLRVFDRDGEFFRVGSTRPERSRFRLITGTSDPRYAAFAGLLNEERLIGTHHRSREELTRPLRSDLLNRVKGSVIRVKPVNTDNVDTVVRNTIRALGEEDAELWNGAAAVEALVNHYKWLIGEVSGSDGTILSQDGHTYAYTFGHRREINQTVARITRIVKHAAAVGIRGRDTSHVTNEDVERDARPGSVLVRTSAEPQQGFHADSKRPKRMSRLQDLLDAGLINTEQAEYRMLEALLAARDTGEIVSREELKRKADVKAFVNKLTKLDEILANPGVAFKLNRGSKRSPGFFLYDKPEE